MHNMSLITLAVKECASRWRKTLRHISALLRTGIHDIRISQKYGKVQISNVREMHDVPGVADTSAMMFTHHVERDAYWPLLSSSAMLASSTADALDNRAWVRSCRGLAKGDESKDNESSASLSTSLSVASSVRGRCFTSAMSSTYNISMSQFSVLPQQPVTPTSPPGSEQHPHIPDLAIELTVTNHSSTMLF